MGISHKNILFGKEARQKLQEGVNILAKSVLSTMGPGGRNSVVDKELSGSPIVTRDGVTVCKEVQLKDLYQNTGVKIAREASQKTASQAGDGTTGTIVLTQSIFNEALKYIDGKVFSKFNVFRKFKKQKYINPVELTRGMIIAKNLIHQYIETNKEIINGNIDKIKQIATISANNDKEFGNIIGECVNQVSERGIIIVEENKSDIVTTKEISKGMQFEKGMKSPYFATDQKRGKYEVENPLIFIINKEVSSFREIVPIINACAQNGKKEIVVIADSFSSDTLDGAIINNAQGAIKMCLIDSPSYAEFRSPILEDLAISLGATVINEELFKINNISSLSQIGMQLPNFPPVLLSHSDFYGTCKKIIVEHDKFIIAEGNGDKEEIELRIKEIEDNLVDEKDSAKIDFLDKRIAKFKGGIARIKVGAPTEIEMKEKKDRFDDSTCAVRAALQLGIVPGGGSTLVHASIYLNDKFNEQNFTHEDQKIGYNILKEAIKSPIQIIANNAGLDGKNLLNILINNYSNDNKIGFNIMSGKFENLIETGVIDPAKVVKACIENAVSSASMLLTTECILEEEIDPTIKAKMLDPGGMY